MSKGKKLVTEVINSNKNAVFLALAVIAANQTEYERDHKATYDKNHRGFRTSHARAGIYDLEYYEMNGDLPVERIAYWKKNLPMYWRQLIPRE